jgi:hypothetical protein
MPFQQANEILLIIRAPPDIRARDADGDRTGAYIDRSLTLNFLKNIGGQPESAFADIERRREQPFSPCFMALTVTLTFSPNLTALPSASLNDGAGTATGQSHGHDSPGLHTRCQRQAPLATLDPGRRLYRIDYGIGAAAAVNAENSPKSVNPLSPRPHHRSSQVQPV